MTHFAIPPGTFPPAEHELAAVIDRESAIPPAPGRPAHSQWHAIALIVPPTIGFKTHQR